MREKAGVGRVEKMKTKIPRLSKTVRRDLEVFKGCILELPCTKEISSLVDCVDCLLEGTDNGQKRNIKQN